MTNAITLPSKNTNSPRIALVLGGGGARGLAHIHALSAFDELGLKPSIIAGTSIGAIVGASYASGLDAKTIRDHSLQTLGKRIDIVRNLFMRGLGSLKDLWNIGAPRNSLLKPEALLEIVFPPEVSRTFEDLVIPLEVVATDYYAQEMVILKEGNLIHAVAASIALPAIFRPVTISGRVLIDGGFSNPLPFDIVADKADVTLAVDVTGGPVDKATGILPTGMEVMFTASQILQNTIIKEKLKTHKPGILLHPPVHHVPVLAFHKIHDILEDTKRLKEDVKYALDQALTGYANLSA